MSYKYASAGSVLAALLAITAPHLPGQSTTPAATPPSDKDEEPVTLSPFVIQSSEDPDSYAAKSTLAGTRIRTDLKDVGSAIQVVTTKFLQDTGATSSQDLLVYTTSTEVGGQGGNFVGAGNGQSIDTRSQRSSPQTNTRVRGLAEADNTRDFFLTDIPWDSYNIGRVDLQRGPNSILFGIGSPAGIVNSSVNTAGFKDANVAEFRFGSFGSTRETLDFNKVILKDELAIRFTGLNDETKYRQDPAFQHDHRLFGTVRFDPKFLKRNGMSTSFRANFETGNVVANRPRIIPPTDAITPWFTDMKKQTYDMRNMGKNSPAQTTPGDPQYSPDNGAINRTDSSNSRLNPNYSPWLGAYGGQIFDQPTVAFGSDTSSAVAYYFMPSQYTTGLPAGINFPWAVLKGVTDYHTYSIQAQLANYQLGAYKDKTVSDPGIFDFYNKLIDGPNKQELQNFHSYNVALSQTFLNNKLGFDLAYDRQSYKQEDDALIGTPYLTVEVASVLPDGRANPNVGRALTVGSPYSNGDRFSDRRSFRATAFGELNFKDIMGKSTLTDIIGRHVFTGLYNTQRREVTEKSWYSYVAADMDLRGGSTSLDSRRIPSVSYLGGSLMSLTSANQANVPNITARQVPYSGVITDFVPTVATDRPVSTPPNVYDLVGWKVRPLTVLNGYSGANRDGLIKGGSAHQFRDLDKAQALVWQGFFWNDVIVPTFGWRKDDATNANAGSAPRVGVADKYYITTAEGYPAGSPLRIADADDWRNPRWTIPTSAADPRVKDNTSAFNQVSGQSRSWSIVVHSPKFIKDRLPLGTDISLSYNRSDNFQPAGGRTDVFGAPLPAPTGKTKDYGITISTLNDKLTFRINRYETSVKNASLDGGGTGALSSVYRIGANEAWGYMFAAWAKANANDFTGGNNYARTTPNDPTSPLIDPSIPLLVYQPAPLRPGQTPADAVKETLALQNAAIDAILDPKNLPPPAFDQAWGINNRNQIDPSRGWAGGGVNWGQPSTLAVTGDTISKGTEYELTAQPTPGWNITINAAKTHAQRTNLASSFAGWVDSRNTFYAGPAGDVRMWNSGYGQQTLRSVWVSEFYASYLLYRLQEKSDVPELRPWRVNLVTNYDFRKGSLKGVSIGGAYRWQDKIVVGYPITPGANPFFDLTKPYMGPTEDAFDVWVGYERKVSRFLTWRVQLNVRNIFASKDLIPVTVQPDGSPGTSRIPEPRVITLTNTLKF